MKIEMYYLILLDDKDASFHVDPRISRVVTFLALRYNSSETAWFQQLNWRIRENLSQAMNNGSWYKLSLLVSEDTMIVSASLFLQRLKIHSKLMRHESLK